MVSRNGDLINRAYLRFTLPSVTVKKPTSGKVGFRWLNWPGHALIKTVELEIGGQRIDKHYAAWLHIWHELTQTAGHAIGYANMVGNTPDLTNLTEVASTDLVDNKVVPSKVLYIPLQFFWNRNPGLALPLIALTAGLKSIHPRTIEHCSRQTMLGSQRNKCCGTQMLVHCC